ncbi:CaiB/BaiF CoA transferase family protein [Pseudohoeflea coraliihabitans]|uniref:CoA transferase n=1 Tax=Pseudohoeflea coraliihabitans TaxID=2860393 RepID=A0ABS6WTN8_9HYPH|nr:CaiB/BaiF CoA-transferase family protein [Pseudohoeflea sp. DP4N28-3]MBW3098430.1 CoA transferase [Pseudohoeflea sp. DP4N28-3]
MLDKMKVLGFTHFVQGPAASQYLADMGADVVKVEPLTGAFERSYGADSVFVGGLSATFMAVNRNKRSIAVDLKSDKGREVIHSLIRQSDVIIENYRIGVLERLGFGYDEVRQIKPDIIYASASGWGASGPMAKAPGQDLLVQARCGLVAATGNLETAPTVPGVPIVDQHGAALLAMAISAAYARKLQTGEGTRIESNLFSAGLDLQAESMAAYYSGNRNAERLRRDPRLASWFLPAPYGVFELKDCHAVISLGGDIDRFADAIGHPELVALAGDRMANRDAFMACLGTELAGWTYQRLDQALAPHGLWYERVQDYDAIRKDPQARENECFEDISVNGEPATLVTHPVRYDGKTPKLRSMPATLGADTRAVLAEAGWNDEEVDALLAAGVIYDGQNGHQPERS